MSAVALSQQPSWQPTRVPSQPDARPLYAASQSLQPNAAAGQSSGLRAAQNEQPAGVVLRWKSVSSSAAPVSTAAASSTATSSSGSRFEQAHPATAFSPPSNAMRSVQPAAAHSAGSTHAVRSASGSAGNPLRGDRAVRVANYQEQPNATNPLTDPFGDRQPALPPSNMPELPPSQFLPQDPLSTIEPPPAPGAEPVQPGQPSPFPSEPQPNTVQEPSPFDRPSTPKAENFGEQEQAPSAEEGQNRAAEEGDDLKMPNRSKSANIVSCNDLRDRVRQMRLSDISLNVSPAFGEGLRARQEGANERLDFAAAAPLRDWTDYTGTIVASGRLVDLRDDRVVLDVNGREQMIPVRDLSDIDIAYVAEAWNLPLKCGIGYEAYAGRQFIPSAVEWKASGLCHKPLYFEDVQLERYGHEVGPVLQPLLSSAHFFGNALILPYKMGIHPPGECQHPLGYYRPGNCAPYMIQPFPFSLRGAAVQAGFVTGAAALIP